MYLYKLQQALTKLEKSSQLVEQKIQAEKEEREIIADYELEISISTPYDQIDEKMARFYPVLNTCPYKQFDCQCHQCCPQDYSQEIVKQESIPLFDNFVQDLEEYPF